jgi:NAD(P)-dependent dehydrogenase (short-subunit alcohol dehydrogenase family)
MTDNSLDIQRLFSLAGKVALVTGGSRGIGYMISQGLLQAGARVYISARKAQPCQEAAAELSRYGDCIALPGDVSDPDSRRQLCEHLGAAERHLHILVNNAGTAWGADYEHFPDSAFDKVMRVNVTAMFALTRDLTPLLAAAGSLDDPARVINIGSMEGLHIPTVHGTGNYAYTASKAAVHHLTRHLAVELGRRQITVNAIAPGFFPSRMSDHAFQHRRREIEGNSLLGRVGKAEEMAGIAVYLSGRAGAYTSGAVIPVDGGTSINHQHAVVNPGSAPPP